MATPSEDGYDHLEVPLALELDAAQYDDLISARKQRLHRHRISRHQEAACGAPAREERFIRIRPE